MTKKILTRLDDTQPLVNVFSKMQSLSKMMPQIQDFEQRLGILHQVEPILENAINTLSKVVDMKNAMPMMPAPVAAPAPLPVAPMPAAPDQLGSLKALLAQAQSQQAPAPEPEMGGLGGLAGLLGGMGGAAEEAPALDPSAYQTPSFL